MVIAVIGVLASAAIVLINPIAQLEKARDNERRGDMKNIQTALELYRADNGGYPGNLNMLTSGSPRYMRTVPQDPKGGPYNYSSPGGSYEIFACAERGKDGEDGIEPGCGGYMIIYRSP